MARKKAAAINYTLGTLLDGFMLELESTRKAPKTILIYSQALALLVDAVGGLDRPAAEIRPEDIQRMIVGILGKNTPATAHNRFRVLRTFFRWAVRAQFLDVSPMAGLAPPKISQHLTPVFSVAEMERLIKACEGTAFDDRRDLAIIRLLIDTGMRRQEIGQLATADVDLRMRTIIVTGKGDKERLLSFGPKSGAAVHRYLVERTIHAHAGSPALWLGLAGPLTPWGIRAVVERRGRIAGVEDIHPHRFRHNFAHWFLANGGTEGDLMSICGWTTRQMVSHYAASVAGERARASHSTFSPGEMI